MLMLLLAALAPSETPTTPPEVIPSVVEPEPYFSELPKAGLSREMFERPEKPKANLVRLFSTDDYPIQSVRNAEAGTVAVIIKVTKEGRVADCLVEQSSGHTALDSQTCRIMWTRARFVPARDRDGAPVESALRQRIRWELPEAAPMPFTPWAIGLNLEFVEEGGITSCSVDMSGLPKEDEGACTFFLQLAGPWPSSVPTPATTGSDRFRNEICADDGNPHDRPAGGNAIVRAADRPPVCR